MIRPRTARPRRVASVLALGTTVALLTGGCGVLSSGLRGVSLPGGADLGDDPYTVTIQFPDVVDLVPQSLVKVADVPVGSVSGIAVDPATWNAMVTVAVNRDVTLPANAEARVRTTSLLGEKFVELSAPAPVNGGTAPPGPWRTARPSRSTAQAAASRSRRCSARCPCSSTVAASPRSRPSRPS
ncbi:MlaD family protein [Pseudonocardia sp. T1-2H]|uniref:MlaD family protein n=1 Tax=Pseudonocardia sp. T1-2H TaxID=3128899 RepID=UPI003100C104